MTTYYVDPTATGDDDGSSQVNAWSTLQRAIDGTDGTQPAAGDTVLCKHTGADGAVDETLTASIDVDGNTGNYTVGYIQYIGVDSSWDNDGTQYVIDGDGTATNCLCFASVADYHLFENFYCKSATSDGILLIGGVGRPILINIRSSLNGGKGFKLDGKTWGFLFRCLADGNSSFGFEAGDYCVDRFLFCCARDNSSDGFYSEYGSPLYLHCLSFDNSTYGFRLGQWNNGDLNLLFGSVSDNNTLKGVFSDSDCNVIIGNRITNHSGSSANGLDLDNLFAVTGWNYFENNYGDNIVDDSLHKEILYNGTSTNIEDQGDTNQGYTSLTEGSEDYNLRSDATLRRTAITIPTGQ